MLGAWAIFGAVVTPLVPRRMAQRQSGSQMEAARETAAQLVTRHQQDDRVVGGVRFINAGSVGLPYEGDGAARWLWVADGEPVLRHTAYDAAGAGVRMLEAGWPDEQSVGAALVDPVKAMTVTRIFEAL